MCKMCADCCDACAMECDKMAGKMEMCQSVLTCAENVHKNVAI